MDDINRKNGKQNVFPGAMFSPVGTAQKEKPPIRPKVVPEVSAIIAESEREPGIEPVDGQVPFTKDHKEIDMQHAGGSMPVDVDTKALGGKFPTILPTIGEVKENLTQPISNSARWLAELGRKILKRFRLWKGK